MTFRPTFLLVIIFLMFFAASVSAQTESVIGQVSNSSEDSYVGGMSGNGRFIVFESRGNIATENPRNADLNSEIFLFDYAQRRIFQITDTKSVLFNPNATPTFDNIRVDIVNTRPVISNDGKWIAFSSNATTSRPLVPNATNPGSFDGNAFTSPTPTPSPAASPTPTPAPNPLTADGNMEMWLYQIPAYAAVADLSAGDEVPLTDLATGTFINVTNTDASQLPRAGTTTTGAFVADDNHDVSISDDGSVIAFVSTRDLVAGGNPFPTADNDEIFTYVRTGAIISQVTKTDRGIIANPIYNKNPTISGNGLRVAFVSTGDDPIDDPASTTNFDTGSNPLASRNEEIFYANLVNGVPTGGKQVTTTTPTNAGDPVNILDLGRRMSRDGRYIAFDSYADLEAGGANKTSFALFVYDTIALTFRQVGPRSDADAGATGGDLQHYPSFTENDALGTPTKLVLETRENIKPDGTVATTAADGLNPAVERPAQIYSFPLPVPPAAAPGTFTRIGKFPVPSGFIASTQVVPSDSLKRMAFTIGLTEFGTGNQDLRSEAFYLIQPTVTNQSPVSISLATGASRMPVSPTAVPTPSPTATPSPTPTPTPTPTPSPSPSPSPTPTPVTPPAVLGISPGMLAILDYQSGGDHPIVARTAVGSINRQFSLPIELSGLTMTINGAACGLKSVGSRHIEFVVPPAIASATAGTTYPLVINNNGRQMKTSVTIVPTRPDIFTKSGDVGPFGRTKIFNVTNTVHTGEPFVIRTIMRRGNHLVPSRMRLYLTGVGSLQAAGVTIRIRDVIISNTLVLTDAVLAEPGVYTIDFTLPSTLEHAGDVPIIMSVDIGGVVFSSRLDDTSTKLFVL